MDYQRLFLENLALVDQTVRFVARRHRLSGEELEELASSVHVKLLENDYAVLRKFQGRSSLRTYLTAVITRHFLDERTARWGKWRPCAKARRLGPIGLLLDRLVNRDGYTCDQAIAFVRTVEETPLSDRELSTMCAELPHRAQRRFVGEEELQDVPAPSPGRAGEPSLEDEDMRFEHALTAAMDRLAPEDRLLLRLRFLQAMPISDIARLLLLEQKPLYRRFEQLMARLRADLEGLGVHSDHAFALLERNTLEVPVLWDSSGEAASVRPSNS